MPWLQTNLSRRLFRHRGAALPALAALGGLGLRLSIATAQAAQVVPPPAFDEPVGTATSEVAVVAGGCFWGVQAVFQHVKGVTRAVSGYDGGDAATADYKTVSKGKTGHAESVEITFDPRQITYGRLLQVYFSVAHDPTKLNRQGPDKGPEYRTAIFPQNAEQARVAKAYIAELNDAHIFRARVVTRIEPGGTFYPAEEGHQDYVTLHPAARYVVKNELPKLDNLQRLFPELYRADPVLVLARSAQ
jgi:peptide-methionine (S)-S-oxide reductase